MENSNNDTDLHRAMAPRFPTEPRPPLRPVRAPRRRPRWLGRRSL
ncbi:hypothetical protein [Modestobacter altitudinis]|nr:hypothetical protein [Modestobacter altitudinis]